MTVKQVIKRDGSIVDFDLNKIRLAILSAMYNCGVIDYDYLETIIEEVEDNIEEEENEIVLSVESIQDIVVSVLKMSEHSEVGIHYDDYRKKKERQRNSMTNIEQSVQKLIDKDAEVVNENANKDASTFNTQRDLTAGLVAKAKGLKDLLPIKIANAHMKGQIHWHDLDYSPFMPMTNCSVLDVETLLRDTVKIGNATIKQPKSIQVAVAKLLQILSNVASSQYGGISLPDLDIMLEPYAKMNYEKHLLDVERYNIPDGENYARSKTIKDIYDSMQSLEYEVNSISASTGQSPFVTVSFGFSKSWIGREIQKSILNVRMNKLEDGKIAIFPKLIFFHQKGLNYYETDPNYDIKKLAIKCASECMYPDVISVDREMEILGHRVTPMGKA